MENKQTDLLQQVKDKYAQDRGFKDWSSIDWYHLDCEYQMSEGTYASETVNDDIAIMFAEAYHAARCQEQGEAFTEDIVKLIKDAFSYSRETLPGGQGRMYEDADEMISDMKPDIEDLNTRAAEYTANQNRELIAWKESALKVLNEIDLQAIGKELGVPLGESVSENLLQKIKDYAGKVAGMYCEYELRTAILLAIASNANMRSGLSTDEIENEIINQLKQSK